MPKQFQVFFSNKVERLFDHFKKELYKDKKPFARRFVAVPSPTMKSWLSLRMANDPTLNIAAGIELAFLDHAIQLLSPSKEKIPSSLELALALEAIIREVHASYDAMESQEKDIWNPLIEYLALNSRKGEKRLSALAEKLAFLFIQYGSHGQQMVAEWKNVPTHWQSLLWKKVYHEGSPWTYPLIHLSKMELSSESLQGDAIHIFARSYISPMQHRFLSRVCEYIPVNYYILSPCQMFWSDVLSDRETHRLQKFWKKKGAAEEQQLALEELLRERNPLLANFGQLGRFMAEQIEESNLQTVEDYVLPYGVQSHERYEDFLIEDALLSEQNSPLTLLEAVQADLALMRHSSGENDRMVLDPEDRTIQVHASSSRMREVENVHDIILGIIDKHAQDSSPITPSDIMVMAPNIVDYASFIKVVFAEREEGLNCQIMDLEMKSQSDLVQGFMYLLSLARSRWEASALLQLLEFEPFQKRHSLSMDDVQQIRAWVQDTGIRWGEDSSHRVELLQRDHTGKEMVDHTPSGTWEEGLGQLLVGMASHDDIDMTKGGLLGKWIMLIRSIRSDLKPLSDGTSMTLEEWSCYLKCLFQAYFSGDKEGELGLFRLLESFERAEIPLAKYPFSSILRHLNGILSKQRMNYREADLQSVRFCSLLPMRAVPYKVIILLGMHEGAFPRQDNTLSLDMLRTHPHADYYPSQTDYDRFQFLEVILSAREYLVISYQGYASSDGKRQPPSLLVTELLQYLDRNYWVGETKPSDVCVKEHPFLAFDSSYFIRGTHYPSYSQSRYRAAEALYLGKQEEGHQFARDFAVHGINADQVSSMTVEMRDLSAIARNPIEAYFRKTLGIYLNRRQGSLYKDEEDFVLSPLERAIIKKASLGIPIDKVLQDAEREGRLPIGGFKPLVIEQIRRDVAELRKNLDVLGVNYEDMYAIELSPRCHEPKEIGRRQWEVPALDMVMDNGQSLSIVGMLDNITPSGMLSWLKDDRVDVLKAWPQFLVLEKILKKYSLPFGNQLIFAKSGKAKPSFVSDPQESLRNYLAYYLQGIRHVSPLIPEWVPPILNEDAKALEKRILQTVSSQEIFSNEHVRWILGGGKLPDPEVLIKHWKSVGNSLFSDLYQQWYPPRGGKK